MKEKSCLTKSMDIGESSEIRTTTIIKEDGTAKLPRKEGPTCGKGERNSERFIPENNKSL